MQELQRCGYIADSRSSMANYMYVRYNTQLEVERALALNGTRVNGNYIGVVRCTWEEVRDSQESNINKIVSSNMDTRWTQEHGVTNRDYVVHENEIYKRAPVKRFSLCTWISEWLFGFCPVFCKHYHITMTEEQYLPFLASRTVARHEVRKESITCCSWESVDVNGTGRVAEYTTDAESPFLSSIVASRLPYNMDRHKMKYITITIQKCSKWLCITFESKRCHCI